MIANRPSRFSSRRVNNLKEIPSTQNQHKTAKSPLNDVVPVPRNTSYDSDEDDPELRVLRETALASRRTIIPTSPTEVTKPPSMTTAVPLKSASSNKPVNGAVKDVRDQPSRQIQRERPEQVQPRQERNSYSSRQSSHNQSNTSKSQPRSKYDDLDLEDLRQRYHASKRSRFARRNDSDGSSSEDEDYMKHARRDRNDQQQPSSLGSIRGGTSDGFAQSESLPAQLSSSRLNRQNSRKDVSSSGADRDRKTNAETSLSDTTSANGSNSSSPVELLKPTSRVELPKGVVETSKWLPVTSLTTSTAELLTPLVEGRSSTSTYSIMEPQKVEVDPMERRRLKFAAFEDRSKLSAAIVNSSSSTSPVDAEVTEN